jgi:WD40 repeat protein
MNIKRFTVWRILAVYGLLLGVIGGAFEPATVDAQAAPKIECVDFPETGFQVCDPFLTYWRQNGGLARQGYPISLGRYEEQPPPPAGDGKSHWVQYFQRGRFELHINENSRQREEAVLLGLLGTEQFKARYGDIMPPADPTYNPTNCQKFPETGQAACGRFLEHWQQNGGLPQFGFPVSPVIVEQNAPPPAGDGKSRRVQYFQRARFEEHADKSVPNDVLLGLLGAEQYGVRYKAPQIADKSLAELFPELARAPESVNDMVLRDNWTGFSSRKAEFYLSRSAAGFEGSAVYYRNEAGISNPNQRVVPAETALAARLNQAEAQEFITRLVGSKVYEAEYEALITHTDDYPSLNFRLQTPDGALTFFSGSQGASYVPWGVLYKNRTFVINNSTPYAAFDALATALNRKAETEFRDRVRGGKLTLPPLPDPDGVARPSLLKEKFSRVGLPGHTGNVYGVAYRPDGTLFATAGGDNTVRLWDSGGNLLKVLNPPEDKFEVIGVVFSADGTKLATGHSEGTAIIWDVASGQASPVSFGGMTRRDSLRELGFTPDGTKLIGGAGRFGNEIKIWDVATGASLRTLYGSVFALLPDGKTLVWLERGEKGVNLTDVDTGRTRTILKSVDSLEGPLAVSPDGKLVAIGEFFRDDKGFFSRITVAEIATEKTVQKIFPSTEFLGQINFSPDSRYLLTGYFSDEQVQIWEVASGKLSGSLKIAEDRNFGFNLAFSPDGKTVLTGGEDVIAWDFPAAKPRFTIERNRTQAQALAVSPDGKTVATGTLGGDVRLWDANNGDPIAKLPADLYDGVYAVTFSPDGKYIAAAMGYSDGARSFPGTIQVWEFATRKVITRIETLNDLVTSLVFSPDNQSIYSAGLDRLVQRWEVPSGKRLAVYRGAATDFFQLFSLAISPDGKTIAAGGDGSILDANYPVKLWDTNTGNLITTLRGHTQSVRTLTFSPDGQVLATGGDEQLIRLWDVAGGGTLRASLKVDTATVTGKKPDGSRFRPDYGTSGLVFSRDGKFLASAHPSGFLRLWNPAAGIELSATAVQKTTGLFYPGFGLGGELFTGHFSDTNLRRWEFGS